MLRGVRRDGAGEMRNFVTEESKGNKFDIFILVAFFILQSLIIACTDWNNDFGLLGVNSKLFGRYTSMRSLHVLQIP